VACAGGENPDRCRSLVTKGRVRINGARQTSPSHAVKAGEVLTIALDSRVRILKITGFSERRGDSAAARAIYDDLQSSPE
jgi:ribosome-associated heat shock protein Hsp15